MLLVGIRSHVNFRPGDKATMVFSLDHREDHLFCYNLLCMVGLHRGFI